MTAPAEAPQRSSAAKASRVPVGARRLPWLLLGLVVLVALVLGSGAGRGRSLDDRAVAIARTIKCPQCSGQSVATSEASSAVAIRNDIAERLRRGQTPDQIRDYYAGRYEESILLNPSSSGSAGIVWILPVLALVGAFGGLALAFRRWRREADSEAVATDEDRLLVAAALSRDGSPERAVLPDDEHGEGSGR